MDDAARLSEEPSRPADDLPASVPTLPDPIPAPPAGDPAGIRERRFAVGTSLRAVAARGTMINGAFLVGVNILSMARGLIMAGFLTTSQYGVWGILVVMTATMTFLRQVGIGDRFVQQDEEDQQLEFQRAFTLELGVSLIFMLAGFGLIAGAAALYDLPEIILPGFLMLLAMPIGSLQLPLAIYYRRMDFVRQRTLQAVDPLLAFVVTIALAFAGVGYWALIIGTLAGVSAGAIVAVLKSPYPLGLRFSGFALRRYGSFGWPLFLASLTSIVLAQGITGIGEATLGLAGVGIIALTSQISQFTDRADKAITDTIYPALCAVKDRVDLLYESFVKSNRIALMWGLPFGVALALFAEDLLVRVLGPEWAPGVELMQFTAVALAINQIGFNWTAFYRALGNTRPIGVASVIGMLAFFALVFPLLALEGLWGLGVGALLTQFIVCGVRTFYLRRLFPGRPVIRPIVRAVVPVIPAALLVVALRTLAPETEALGALLELAVFIVATAAATFIVERSLLREAGGYLRGHGRPVRGDQVGVHPV